MVLLQNILTKNVNNNFELILNRLLKIRQKISTAQNNLDVSTQYYMKSQKEKNYDIRKEELSLSNRPIK